MGEPLDNQDASINSTDSVSGDGWLSAPDVAKRLGKAHRTVLGLLEAGELVGYRIGRNWSVKESDLTAYLDAVKNTKDMEQGQ